MKSDSVLEVRRAEFAPFDWFCIEVLFLRHDHSEERRSISNLVDKIYIGPNVAQLCVFTHVFVCVWVQICAPSVSDCTMLWHPITLKLGSVGLEEEMAVPTEDTDPLSDKPDWSHHVVTALPTRLLSRLWLSQLLLSESKTAELQETRRSIGAKSRHQEGLSLQQRSKGQCGLGKQEVR